MPSALSVDLRERVVAAVAEGVSQTKAAARFGVSVASASRWCERAGATGDLAPKPRGGDQRSQGIEAHAERILTLCADQPSLFLSEVRNALAEQGIPVSRSSLWRFFKRHAITRKKTQATRPSSSVQT